MWRVVLDYPHAPFASGAVVRPATLPGVEIAFTRAVDDDPGAVTIAHAVEAAGVERAAFLDALDGTVMASRFVSYKGAALRQRDYAATFRTADMRKDLDLAVSLGAAARIPLPVASAVLGRLDQAVDAGYADDDFLSLVCMQQVASGRPADLPREHSA